MKRAACDIAGGAGPAPPPRGFGRWEVEAAREFARRVRRRVPAELVQASLFGSKSRGEGRPESDVDVLLVFRWLPRDREPQASQAEQIADEVAGDTGVPVTTWSVSLADLHRGRRTPMLVDALHDSIPLWRRGAALPALPFTPEDALHCVRALLTRLEEGSEEFAGHLARGDLPAAARRARDDVVRLCTAALLLRGETRPRRAAAVRRCAERLSRESAVPAPLHPVLAWAASSFGPAGRDEHAPVPPPPGGLGAARALIGWLAAGVARERARLARRVAGRGNPRAGMDI